MQNLSYEIQIFTLLLKQNVVYLLGLLAMMWSISFLNWMLGGRLNVFGIVPRTWHGFIGIPISPWLHGDFNHLFFNSIPLFVLANFVLLQGKLNFYCVTTEVVLLSGLAIWAFGRNAIHIGASGLIMGYFAYVLATAYRQRTGMAIALAVVSIYYFAGLIFDLFPSDFKTSWEGHVFGFAAGLIASLWCPAWILHLFV